MGISAEHSSKDAVFTGNGNVSKMSEKMSKMLSHTRYWNIHNSTFLWGRFIRNDWKYDLDAQSSIQFRGRGKNKLRGKTIVKCLGKEALNYFPSKNYKFMY